ncbi:hypothetical protein LIER_12407 [Lithospermum erythrorhizon]|uniref:Uncharacterized protein n=1 Tax=Lithospermum erythrorhizon TaxID=34254 RepID=A0AAV3PT04_LITER
MFSVGRWASSVMMMDYILGHNQSHHCPNYLLILTVVNNGYYYLNVFFPLEYPPEKRPSPLKDLPEEFVKQLAYQGIVRYENLVFTPYSDLFAAVTLKQEDTHSDIFEEIDDYPLNTLAPTTVLGQDLPAGSSNRATKALAEGDVHLASEQGEDSDDNPSYIINSLPVPFTDSELWDIKEYFCILDDVGIRVPVEGESIMTPLVNKKDKEGAFYPGQNPLFLAAFSFGMRLLFSMFVNNLLEHINRA